ncbi:putative glycosyltransferase EpsD [Thalassoglobus neptunius]|uniref:Putative glycosyltransferase EpsD n=1 Tax=Thalassoglobus neptunius TaxID=1938619 RepID=A0A5C5WBV8_9PLAN|nr:glycosyltransferase [Thalassoglobus neptunius]TWT47987.1 putative glycosyltransferase EpsD [Thalassoglobus neptunius]
MRKVLIVIPTLDRSGAEKQFVSLAIGLKERGDSIEVIALTRSGPYEEDLREAGISVTVLEKKTRFDVAVIWKLRSEIIKRSPDVVLSCLFAANSATRLATTGLGKTRPKVIISERCVDSWKSSWQHWLDRRLQSATDLMIANSESVKNFYAEQGFPKQRIQVIPNGVDTPASPTIPRHEFLKSCDLPEDAQLLMFVGRLAPQKRIKDLLWAVQMLRHSCPNAYFLIIGDGPEREELKLVAKECEAEDQTRFLGAVPNASELLHHADVFWLASEFEGMSNSLMEAMACGKPSVVSDIPPNRELISHGKEGWLVDLGDLAGFAQYTVRLIREPTVAQQLGEAAARKMTEGFRVSQMVDRYSQAIDELLSNDR